MDVGRFVHAKVRRRQGPVLSKSAQVPRSRLRQRLRGAHGVCGPLPDALLACFVRDEDDVLPESLDEHRGSRTRCADVSPHGRRTSLDCPLSKDSDSRRTGLHRLDRQAPDVKQCLSPSDDWTESEERRRTFWMTLCQDRYASIGTGWPMVIDERDVLTKLPASEDAFESGRPEQGATLQECLGPSGASKLTPFGGVVLLAVLFGRNLTHLHRHDSEVDDDGDLNGPFWKRHRQMDNFILNTSLSLPSSLRMPAGLSNPNVVFTNMSIHTSTICLHQAAIFKAEKKQLPAYVSSESKLRCITAANEIASIMRTISHTDLSCVRIRKASSEAPAQ